MQTQQHDERMPVPCRVVVGARDRDGFVARYRRHIDGDRIFLFTRVPPAPGTRIRFQIHLATGDCVLRGDGVVLRAVPEASAQAGGMEVRFVATDEASRALLRSLGDGVPDVVIENEKTMANPTYAGREQ
jgi:hypothetical protein